jgi:protease I
MRSDFITIFIIFLIFTSLCIKEVNKMNLEGKKIAMIIAHEGFRDEEFEKPYEIFTDAGAKVEIVSTDLSEAKGMLGKTVKPTMLIDDLNVDNFDAIIFVGGIGSQQYFDNEKALNIAKEAYEKNKIIAAICIAPIILANAGILDGKKVTVWDSGNGEFISKIESKGANYLSQNVVREDNIITANGPHAAKEFGEEIARVLSE